MMIIMMMMMMTDTFTIDSYMVVCNWGELMQCFKFSGE